MPETTAHRPRTLREHVAEVLRDRTRVSRGQEAAVRFSRDFFLRACPGSGKTRTIGLRLAWARVDGRGRAIAATSYTNAAVAEMQKAAAGVGVPIGDPHWVGTIHSFLIRYVLQPFAPLALGSSRQPRIVAESFQQPPTDAVFYERGKPPVSPWDFEFTLDGRVEHRPAGFSRLSAAAINRLQEPVKRAKAKLAARGFVSQSDAMYFSMRLLEDRPDLAAAVAARFDELIVDEVQDTSPMQLRCVDLLRGTGELRSLVLCGDLDQAIYSFTGADPDFCEAFATRHNLETLTLTENYRSSQAICDVVPSFSLQQQPDVARGPQMAFGVEPELLRFDGDYCEDLLATYRTRLGVLDVQVEGAVVLARRHEFKDKLNGSAATKVPRTIELLGRAGARLSSTGALPAATARAIDALLASIAFEEPAEALEDAGNRAAIRDATMAVLDGLPSYELSLADWIAETQAVVKTALSGFEPLAKRVGDRIRRFKDCEKYAASDVFAGARADVLEADVIHRVKGESHDAVLLVAEPATDKRDNARLWIEALESGEVSEEVRVAYVALTRARRYCAVALPDSCHPDVEARFIAAGFRPVEDPSVPPDRKPHAPPPVLTAGELAAAATPEELLAALGRFAARSPEEAAHWSELVVSAAGVTEDADLASWSIRADAPPTADVPDDELQPSWYRVDVEVDADINVINAAGEVRDTYQVSSTQLSLRLLASLRAVAEGIDIVVHAVEDATP